MSTPARPWAVRPRANPAPFAFPLAISGLALALSLAGGCESARSDFPDELLRPQPTTETMALDHRGPQVVAGRSGPARFAPALWEAFDVQRALGVVAFADRYYRAPGNEGFDAVLDHLRGALEAAGYGSHPRLDLYEIELPVTGRSLATDERIPAPAWTPRSGQVALLGASGPEVLHRFARPEDVDRVILPVNAPSARVEAPVCFDLDEDSGGRVLVIEAPASNSVIRRARERGVAAIVSASLYSFNLDPTGQDRHRDAVQYRQVPADVELPMFQISPRSYERIHAAWLADPEVRLQLEAVVDEEERPLRTLVAVVQGSERADEAVAVMSHVQEPGACDNASGVGGLLESAVSLADLLTRGRMTWPARSLVFLWGDEFRMTSSWLEHTQRTPVAGVSSDMTGQSHERTGAIALLERMPDPGALEPLPPDEHTPWGAGEVSAESLEPNGLAVIARCALADVTQLSPGWRTAEHPWEGGSDHDEFIERGLPACLFWHFTDFAYHTSLDRMDFVDGEEMRRTGVAILSTALAVADPKPEDLDRYLRTLEKERLLRVQEARKARLDDIADLWESWCLEARHWLRRECLGIPAPTR